MFPKNPFIHNTYKRHRLEMYSVITVSCSVFLSLPEHFVMRNCEIMLSRRLVGTLFAYVANTPATELWCLYGAYYYLIQLFICVTDLQLSCEKTVCYSLAQQTQRSTSSSSCSPSSSSNISSIFFFL